MSELHTVPLAQDGGGDARRGTPHASDILPPLHSDPSAPMSEMTALMRSFDWRATPLGPQHQWPESLRMVVRLMMANRLPMLLWWGPSYIQLYNDPYRPVLGTKHPKALGQAGEACWPEIWNVLRPLVDTPFHGGPPTWIEDLYLEINRHGFVEETHFTVAYSPVPDESAPRGIGGVLATIHEITEKVVGERRMALLRNLGVRSLAEVHTASAACTYAADIIATDLEDVPFALLYLIDESGTSARLAGAAGVAAGLTVSPPLIDLAQNADPDHEWPFGDVLREGTSRVVEKLASRFGDVPPGPWTHVPHTAVVLPIPSNVAGKPAGFFVGGVSALLALDERYVGFLELLAARIATAIANAEAYEKERQRAAALAELDRAKTAFFSNVSHEFRTPLTLLLGPAEDALADTEMSSANRERVEIIHRNALRLNRLVNSLLDYARIEAGRIEAVYEPTDLAAFTAELASTFRSAIERTGLSLVVSAPPLSQPVYVDRDMWEKVVLNLVSNAFKHTFEGSITVSLREHSDMVELTVRDTGVGISAQQMPRVFERFFRVSNARSRTYEGTGIGLALVEELVGLHGGEVTVTSEEGAGTTFVACVPMGTAHLPSDRIGVTRERASTAAGAASFVAEAMRWSSGDADAPLGGAGIDLAGDAPTAAAHQTAGARVLLADDNADMRDYVARLLRAQGWIVETAADGATALEMARASLPDVVLSDVMMPRMGGFDLLHALRAAPATSAIPVILLSARAGEESRIEGLETGADDYLTKPFSARELVARVGAHLALAQSRARSLAELVAERELRVFAERTARVKAEESEGRFRATANAAPVMIWTSGPDMLCDWFNVRWTDFTGRSLAAEIGDGWRERMHPDDLERCKAAYSSAERERDPFSMEYRLQRRDEEYRWLLDNGVPRYAIDGTFLGYIGSCVDVTDQRLAREAAEAGNRAKSEFLAAMSHELRTPLNAIGGYAQLMELGLNGPVTDQQREALRRIQRSEQYLLSLINDILNFTKVEAGAIAYDRVDVALDSVIESARPLVQPQLAAKGITYASRVPHDVIVRADFEKLLQIVLNLLSNAIKFCEDGSRVTIHMGEADATPQGMALLCVSDTGIGIPLDKQQAIFDPFVQVRRNLTSPSEGTGLGLAISRNLARGMGGDLNVRSAVGEGSTFIVGLPLA